MNTEVLINKIGEAFAKTQGNASYVTPDNICWKMHEGKWIGKRSVYTHDFRTMWLNEVDVKDIKTWSCGRDADYNEIFTR